MNRRRLIQSAAALAAGLILPPTLTENVEAVERRYWSLDQTMLSSDWHITERFDGKMPGWEKGIIIKDQWYPVYRGFSVICSEPSLEGLPYRTWTYSATLEFLP